MRFPVWTLSLLSVWLVCECATVPWPGNSTLSRVKRASKLAIFYSKDDDEKFCNSNETKEHKAKTAKQPNLPPPTIKDCCSSEHGCGEKDKKGSAYSRFLDVVDRMMKSSERGCDVSSEEDISDNWEKHIYKDTKWPSSEESQEEPSKTAEKRDSVCQRKEKKIPKSPKEPEKCKERPKDDNPAPEPPAKGKCSRKDPKDFFDNTSEEHSPEEEDKYGRNWRKQRFEEFYQSRRRAEKEKYLREYLSRSD